MARQKMELLGRARRTQHSFHEAREYAETIKGRRGIMRFYIPPGIDSKVRFSAIQKTDTAMITISSRERWIPWLLFAATFLAFVYFHQGGGWNQNVRFAMVRAIIEEGSFSIDSYLIYTGSPSDRGSRLVRVPVRNAEFTYRGRTYAFQWRDTEGHAIPLHGPTSDSKRDLTYIEPQQVAVSGDLTFYNGRFHPAKAPGGAIAAVPAYFILYHIERIFGMDPDDWKTLTMNAWLTSALSVGLLSAVGCVLFYRLALKLSGGRSLESLLAALTLAFGTMYFSYGTALYEHNVVAVALLTSFYLLHVVKEETASLDRSLPEGRARLLVALAGLCAGYAAITNYLMAVVVVLLGSYLLLSVRRTGGWLWFGLGVLVPLLLVLSYNVACFSTPFTTNYSHEDPMFKAGGNAFLGVFGVPQWEVLPMVLFSPYRGLFVTAPVLLFGLYGLNQWTRRGNVKAEAWLMISILLFFLLFVMMFNGWHGGWAVGPRYLAPALPFLTLPLVPGFTRFFKTLCVLAVLSIAINLLVTAVDPQAPVGNARIAMIEGRQQWQYSPLTDYVWPLFAEGRAGPLLRAQRDYVLQLYDGAMQAEGEPAPVRALRLSQLRNEVDADIRFGDPAPLLPMRDADGRPGLSRSEMSTITGPVSANPVGIYEGWMYRVFPLHSQQAHWNSFNAGEFLLERSRWSLIPILLITGVLVALMIRMAERSGRGEEAAGLSEMQRKRNTT
jgi:hypothetical protein